MKLLRLIMYIIFMFEIKRMDLLWIMLYRYWGLSFPEFSFDLHRQWGVVWGPSGIRGVSLSPERGHPRTGEQLRGKLWVWVTEQLPWWSKTKTTSSGKRAIPISFRYRKFVGGSLFQVVKVDSGRVFILIITIGCHW